MYPHTHPCHLPHIHAHLPPPSPSRPSLLLVDEERENLDALVIVAEETLGTPQPDTQSAASSTALPSPAGRVEVWGDARSEVAATLLQVRTTVANSTGVLGAQLAETSQVRVGPLEACPCVSHQTADYVWLLSCQLTVCPCPSHANMLNRQAQRAHEAVQAEFERRRTVIADAIAATRIVVGAACDV
jgi:hypothetical protein